MVEPAVIRHWRFGWDAAVVDVVAGADDRDGGPDADAEAAGCGGGVYARADGRLVRRRQLADGPGVEGHGRRVGAGMGDEPVERAPDVGARGLPIAKVDPVIAGLPGLAEGAVDVAGVVAGVLEVVPGAGVVVDADDHRPQPGDGAGRRRGGCCERGGWRFGRRRGATE